MVRSDTSPEIQKQYDDLWRGLSCEERFLKGLQWIQFNREFLLAGIRARFPNLTEKQLRQELWRELYPADSYGKRSSGKGPY